MQKPVLVMQERVLIMLRRADHARGCAGRAQACTDHATWGCANSHGPAWAQEGGHLAQPPGVQLMATLDKLMLH